MNKRIVGSLLAVIFVLTSCSPAAPAFQPDIKTGVVTIADVAISIAIKPDTDECFACHTDKQRLIDTAKPEEVVEKESSGAG